MHSELSIAVLVLVASFVFLDVPLLNSVLLGPVIVGMGALGATVLRGIVQGFPITLLSLLGPGLMVGGPVALVIFNLVGRGTTGTVTTIVLIAVALLRVQRSGNWSPDRSAALWTLSQVLGMSAISMSWEFPELLPAAIVLFGLGFLNHATILRRFWLRALAVSLCIVALAVSAVLRRDFWWLVSDDYSLFGVMSEHITRVGPFSNWGALSFSQYHWLSYGLNGLWNQLSSSPDIMTTLSQVTPAAYTISLSSSLILVVRTLRSTPLTALSLLPVWFILSINNLDWSGTSTAAAYATLSAFVATTFAMIKTKQGLRRRWVTYAIFLPIVALTKFGSLFAAALVLLLAEASVLFGRSTRKNRTASQLAFSVLAMISVIPVLGLAGTVTDGFSLTTANPALGELSTLGVPTIILTLALHRLYLFVPLGLALLMLYRRLCRDVTTERELLLLFSFSSLSMFGLLLDMIISGKSQSFDYSSSNRFMYFSGPMYFIASLTVLAPLQVSNWPSVRKRASIGLISLLFSGAGLVWIWKDLNWQVWRLIRNSFSMFSEVNIEVLSFFTTDSRIAASAAALLLLLLAIRWRVLLLPLLASTLISVVVLTIADRSTTTSSEFRRERGSAEVAAQYGTPDSRAVGAWLKMHGDKHDVIATNSLNSSDMSLALWSNREFLVLAPGFALVLPDKSVDDVNHAIQLSDSFGDNPTPKKAEALRERGVRWFVVDRTATLSSFSTSDWNVQYENERFLVIKL